MGAFFLYVWESALPLASFSIVFFAGSLFFLFIRKKYEGSEILKVFASLVMGLSLGALVILYAGFKAETSSPASALLQMELHSRQSLQKHSE